MLFIELSIHQIIRKKVTLLPQNY